MQDKCHLTLRNGTVMNVSSYSMLMHSYWRGQEPVPAGIHFAVGVFITIAAILALFSNLLVVWTCLRHKDLRTRPNILIINLAVGDLMMCIIDFPILAAASVYRGWPFGRTVCQVYAFITAVAGMVTINTLAVIAVDRYWAVVRRPIPGHRLPKNVTAVAVTLIWAYSIFWALCPIWGWGAYVLDGIGTTCTFDYLTRDWNNRTFVLVMASSNFALPFSLMIFSYARIWLVVREVKIGIEKESTHITLGNVTYAKGSVSSLAITKIGSDNAKEVSMETEICQSPSLASDKIYDSKHENKYMIENNSRNENTYRKKVFETHSRFHSGKKAIYFFCKRATDLTSRSDQEDFDFEKGKQHGHVTSNNENSNQSKMVCTHFRTTYHKRCVKTQIKDTTDKKTNNNCSLLLKKQVLLRHFQARLTNSQASTSQTEIITKPSEDFKLKKSHITNSYSRIFARIRLKCKPRIGSNLLLQHNRYRLHCEHKTAKIIMSLVLAFTFTWCPYMIISLIGLFGDQTNVSYLTSVIPSLVAKTSMVFNPFLYSISHPKVRKRILNALLSKPRIKQPQTHRFQEYRPSMSTTNY